MKPRGLITRFEPTSFAWLLRHEIRLLWRGSLLVRTRRHVLIPVIAGSAVFQGVALLAGLAASQSHLAAPMLVMIANLNILFLFFLMLSRAMTSAIDVLYSRGDVDFLLAAPIPPSRVLAVRMLGVAGATAAPWLLLGGALANALALFGHPAALAIYPMIAGLALAVCAVAFALVVLLVGQVGPRLARTIAHSLALLVGLFIFALGQAPRFVAPHRMAHLWLAFMPNGQDGNRLVWIPGRAMTGEALPLAGTLALFILLFVLVQFTLGKKFASGAISAASYAKGPARGTRRPNFREQPFGATLIKNLRLLLRFPGLTTQTVYRSLTLVPVAVILSGKVNVANGPAIVVPLIVFLAGQLSLFFCSVITGSDQAPDLLNAAPAPAGLAERASSAASLYATMLIMAVPLMGVSLRASHTVPVAIAAICGAAYCNLAVAQKFPIPLMRPEFGKSQKGSMLGLVLGVAVSSAWGAAAYLAVAPHPFGFLHTA